MCEILLPISLGLLLLIAILYFLTKNDNSNLEHENNVLSEALKREAEKLKEEAELMQSINAKVEHGIVDWESTYQVDNDS